MIDKELIDQLIEGDEPAFRMVVEEYKRTVLNCCFRFVKNYETAEDLTQDVFVEVFRSIKKFKGNSKLSTWIYRIAVTKSIDYLRFQKRKKRFAFLSSLSGEDQMEELIIKDNGNNPEIELERKERIRVLNLVMDSLPENQKVAFTLSKYDEMSYKEIADILATTVSAVESLIHRAKNNLENKLYKYYKKII